MNSKEREVNYGKYSVLPFNTVMLLESLECMLCFICDFINCKPKKFFLQLLFQ